MKILIAMASISSESGGPSTAARSMALSLVKRGHQVWITAHDDAQGSKQTTSDDYSNDSSLTVLRFPLTTRAWQYSKEYRRWINENIDQFDFVLSHSLFLSHSYFVARACRRRGVPYAIRPHGSLNRLDLANRRLLKMVYLRTIERRALTGARFAFCTSDMESEQARDWFGSRIVQIPLGVDEEFYRVVRDIVPSRILFLARIAEKKGLEILIRALAQLKEEPGHEALELRVAGDASGPLGVKARELAKALELSQSVDFVGHVRLDRRLEEFASAQVYVLPSLDENFGISVAEALAVGCPVVITPGVSHATAVTAYRAGIVVERNVDAVAAGIRTVLDLTQPAYDEMSKAARRLALDRFSWDRVAEQLEQAILVESLQEG